MEVTIIRSDQPEKLLCTVWQTLMPDGASNILVRIKVPNASTLKSVLLKTASGELALEVIDSIPLAGEYEMLIDNQKTNRATSGTLFVDVEGNLETKTATCAGILLPKSSPWAGPVRVFPPTKAAECAGWPRDAHYHASGRHGYPPNGARKSQRESTVSGKGRCLGLGGMTFAAWWT
jgi:hypothetical protein